MYRRHIEAGIAAAGNSGVAATWNNKRCAVAAVTRLTADTRTAAETVWTDLNLIDID